MLKQKTIQSLTRAVGVGLHSGQLVELTLRPAPPNTGIVFRRIDLAHSLTIALSPFAVSETRMASTLSNGNIKVSTVEHLLSACSGLGIDNLIVDVTTDELPILDGSAASFVYLILSAGILLQPSAKVFIRVTKKVEVSEKYFISSNSEGVTLKQASLSPFNGFKLSFQIDFEHPAVNSTGQYYEFNQGSDNYCRDIARARTFGFTKEVELMRAKGLGLGGGLDNVIVVDDYKVLNYEGLRYKDEFVKHKILDAMGDLYILGKPLLASFNGVKSGHYLNNKLLRELLTQTDAWEEVSFADLSKAPLGFNNIVQS